MSENRIDQRMPLEFVTDSFLPSETSARSNEFKKTLLLKSKTVRQRMGQGKRSEPDMLFVCLAKFVEGLFYLMALAIS
jgi:hypothetical protein